MAGPGGGRRILSRGELMGVASAVVVAALVAFRVAAGEPEAECHLSFEPPRVTAGGEALEMLADPSEDIGNPDAVVVEPASGLVVTLFEDRPLQLFVNPGDAVVGDWPVSLLRGEEELCRGPLEVTSPSGNASEP